MKNREFSFPIRGQILKLFGNENIINLVTRHQEGLLTPIYTIDLAKGELSHQNLPIVVNSVVLYDKTYYVGGKDKKLYKVNSDKTNILLDCENDIIDLKIYEQELFVLTSNALQILNLKNEKIAQKINLEKASTFDISPNGQWIAIGFENGVIQAFSREEQKEWIALDSATVHNSVVNNILFDGQELQIISTGFDKKMMMTQIRGVFEITERTSKGHEGVITTLISGTDNVFFSGSQDATVKLWNGGYTHQVPSTTKFNKPVNNLCYWKTTDAKFLAIVDNNSNIRVYSLDNKNKPENELYSIYPIESWVNREFSNIDTKIRESALKLLSEFSDKYTLKTLAEKAILDTDANLRLLATKLILTIEHESTDEYLSGLLKSMDKDIYLTAFEQLLKRKKLQPLEIVKSSINVNNKDLGYKAIEVLGNLAKDNPQALNFLVSMINNNFRELRTLAFELLKDIYKKDPINVINLGLTSSHEDIKILALKQGYNDNLLKNRDFLRLIRRHLNDNSMEVRYTSFALSLLTQPALAEILRSADENIQRRLNDIDGKKAGKFKESAIKSLSESERSPLVEAMSTSALDICLAGANALSIIKDQRAFGVLLQLSRESNELTRMAVCRAFNFLGDSNAIPRLKMMLYDNAINVADAAFTALDDMLKDIPLVLLEAGLNAPNNKIRLRTVSLISKLLKTNKQTINFLEIALNDKELIVRKEAFKTLLNSEIYKTRAEILRFALKSAFADIRQEVLLELESIKKENWGLELITEMLNDPASEIRSKSFKLLQASDKDSKIVYQDALNSKYEDVRYQALELLLNSKKKDEKIFSMIDNCTKDESLKIRQKALQGLIDNKCLKLLEKALVNEHQDIRVGAAKAQASYGIKSSLAPLLELIRSKEPLEKKEEWKNSVKEAIKGLIFLGDPSSYEDLKNLIGDPKGYFNKEASEAIRFVTTHENQEDLVKLFASPINNIKYEIGLAMCAIGDQRSASEVFSKKTEKSLTSAFMLRNVFREHLYSFMDNQNVKLRNKALLLCLLTELGERPDTPEYSLSGLSASNVDIRLKSALALENYHEFDSYLKTIVEIFNYRFKEKWEVKEEIFTQIAVLLTRSDSNISLAVAEEFLQIIDKEKQVEFEKAWAVITTRYQEQLNKALTKINKTSNKKANNSLLPLVTGTYVGVLRLKDYTVQASERQTALSCLANIAKKVPEQLESVSTCLKVALHDNSFLVRNEAFENLKNMLSNEDLVSEALSTEYSDITRKSLDLLAEGTNTKKIEEILSDIQLSFTNGLEIEASAVFSNKFGLLKANTSALNARSNSLRYQALISLFNLYDKETEACNVIYKALDSEFSDVKENTAILLAQKQDKKSIPILKNFLNSNENHLIELALKGFELLNEKSTAELLMERLEREPELSSSYKFIEVLKSLDNPDITSQAIKLFLTHKNLRNSLFDLILQLSGYHQNFKIINKEVVIDEQKAHKLDDSLFEQLLKSLCEIDEKSLLIRLIPKTAFCKLPSIDNYLDTLTKFNDENVRQLALTSCATRLIEFSVKPDTLKSALSHNDAITKFLSAEGLALAGYDYGIQVLLTGVDMLQNLNHRERCVLALGKLASLRALDTLLTLANNNEHALQECAIEAIGNMKKSEKSNEIFELLKKATLSDKSSLKARAITGLRWFDTPEGWHLIRELASIDDWMAQQKAIELLRYDSNKEEAIECLSKLIQDENTYFTDITCKSLLHLYQKEPIKAYYLFLLSSDQYDVQRVAPNYFEILQKEGKSDLLLQALVKMTDEDMINKIKNIIINREELPVKEALALLPDANNDLTEVILQILVRANKNLPTKDLESLMKKTWEKYTDESNYDKEQEIKVLQRFIWYCGCMKIVPEIYFEILKNQKVRNRFLNLAVLEALENCKLDKEMLSIVKNIALYDEIQLRVLAVKLIEKNAPKETNSIFEGIIDTPQAFLQINFKELLSNKKELFINALKTGIPISSFTEEDISDLVGILKKAENDEALIFTVLEVLGNINNEKAEKELEAFAKIKDQKKELKNFALKLKRKSERIRDKITSSEWLEVLA